MRPFILILLTVSIPLPAPAAPDCARFAARAPKYFRFDADKNLWPEALQSLAARYSAPKVLVGFNPQQTEGIQDTLRDRHYYPFAEAVPLARKLGFRLHVYLEGPHGPTGEEMDPEEKKRRDQLIRKYHLTEESWAAGGWMRYLKDELVEYSRQGFESFEVDNLPQDSRFSKEDPEKPPFSPANPNREILRANARVLMEIYAEITAFLRERKIPMRLMLKNQDEFQLAALAEEFALGARARIRREELADFHIAEKAVDGEPGDSPGNVAVRAAQYRGSAALCLQLIPSDNTFHYRVEGAYNAAGLERPPALAPDADVTDNCDPTVRDFYPPRRFGDANGKKCQPLDAGDEPDGSSY